MNSDFTGLEAYEAPRTETVAVYWDNAILQNEGLGSNGDNYDND
jgi:hypothetical protein